MSKSYNNIIPLFAPEKQLRKLIMKIKTNSQLPGEPKDPDNCSLFGIYRAFATREEAEATRQLYRDGIGWGDMKNRLFEYLNEHLKAARERYDALVQAPEKIEGALLEGAETARTYARPFLNQLRNSVGIRALGSSG